MRKIGPMRRLALGAVSGVIAAGALTAPAPPVAASISPSATATTFVTSGPNSPQLADPPPKCHSAKCYMKWWHKENDKGRWHRFKEHLKHNLKHMWEHPNRWKWEREHGQNIGPPHG